MPNDGPPAALLLEDVAPKLRVVDGATVFVDGIENVVEAAGVEKLKLPDGAGAEVVTPRPPKPPRPPRPSVAGAFAVA